MYKFGKKKKEKKEKQVRCTTGQTKHESKLTYIAKSNIKGAGKGIFAKIDIKKGTRLGYYDGKYMNEKTYQKVENQDYIWQVKSRPNLYVDARLCKKAILRYINGAKTKSQKKKINVEPYTYKSKLYYRTIKNVKKGTELLIDYGDYYW